VLDALTIASLSGISVKLLVPGVSDSVLVNLAARSYYGDLVDAGVEIYQYRKGFVHAKTLVADDKIAMVGMANMDFRSFDLNFEVNAIVYDKEIATELRDIFYEDLRFSEKMTLPSGILAGGTVSGSRYFLKLFPAAGRATPRSPDALQSYTSHQP
jgi:cardiolipin synthase